MAGRKPTAREIAWDNADLDALKLSPEVAKYLRTRGYSVPTCPPLWKTPEPAYTKTAVARRVRFNFGRVDHVIASFRQLRHTKGRFAGQVLEPDVWEVAYVIAPWAGWEVKSPDSGEWVRIITNMYVELPRKNGKGIDCDTPLLTDRGWIKFGDVKVGDLVHAENGRLVPVTYVSDEHSLPCYRVEFASGQSVTCDEQHLWTVWDRYGGEVTIDTPTLFANHKCGKRGDNRYLVRTDRIVQRPEVSLPIDPYLLGAWLGDGATDQARISGIDEPILDRFRGAGYELVPSGGCTWGIKPGFRTELIALGVLGDKHVPDAYLTASAGQRLELLRGLMDTDGGVNVGPNTPRVEFTSAKKCLADAVLMLARSLGWKATIREGRSSLNGRDYGPKWRVTWTAYRERSPFALARKTNLLASQPLWDTRALTNVIKSVSRVESVPTRCIQVDHPSSQFLVGEGFVPTHNTTIAGGIAIYMTGADGEFGAQVLAAATMKDQAKFVFEPMRQLVIKSGLRAYLKPFSSKIVHTASGSYFQPIANVGDAQHGADIHCGVFDELHLYKNMELIDALETGTGSRTQPLILFITTADAGKRHTPYAVKRERIEKLCRGVLKDPTAYGVIFAAEKPEYEDGKLVRGDDPFAEATLRKANPGYGISPTKRFLEGEVQKAKESPAEYARFLRLHLGIRTKQETRYLDVEEWDTNAGMVDPIALKGRECYGGLDLGSVSDLSSLVWVFPNRDDGTFDVLARVWTPEDNLEVLDGRTAKAASTEWIPQGVLTKTPGNVTDYDFIQAQIVRDMDEFDVRELAYDPWNANQLVNNLINDGAPMVTMRQGFVSMSAPTKDLHRLIKLGAQLDSDGVPIKPMIRHGGNPIMRWMVDNFAVAMDPSGNVKPDKENAGDKIDGVVALIMGLSRAMSAAAVDNEAWVEFS